MKVETLLVRKATLPVVKAKREPASHSNPDLTPRTYLPDARGEMQALATDLQRAGIHILTFSKKFHVGELDTLARLVKTSLLKSEDPANSAGNAWWPARLLENRVEGISINTQTERRVDTVLARL